MTKKKTHRPRRVRRELHARVPRGSARDHPCVQGPADPQGRPARVRCGARRASSARQEPCRPAESHQLEGSPVTKGLSSGTIRDMRGSHRGHHRRVLTDREARRDRPRDGAVHRTGPGDLHRGHGAALLLPAPHQTAPGEGLSCRKGNATRASATETSQSSPGCGRSSLCQSRWGTPGGWACLRSSAFSNGTRTRTATCSSTGSSCR